MALFFCTLPNNNLRGYKTVSMDFWTTTLFNVDSLELCRIHVTWVTEYVCVPSINFTHTSTIQLPIVCLSSGYIMANVLIALYGLFQQWLSTDWWWQRLLSFTHPSFAVPSAHFTAWYVSHRSIRCANTFDPGQMANRLDLPPV